MALSDDVQTRISSQRLIELTNDGSPTASTIDTTILGNASTDIAADFELFSSEDYASTNATHVAIAVPAVMGKLYEYMGKISPLANESIDIFVVKCERLKEGNIPGPVTNSNYKITREAADTRLDFDARHFQNYKPGRNSGSDEDE